jgi:hypothetical protein
VQSGVVIIGGLPADRSCGLRQEGAAHYRSVSRWSLLGSSSWFFERLDLLSREGAIDAERWKVWEVWIRYSLSASTLFRDVWHESCGLHHADFVPYIETTFDDGECPQTASHYAGNGDASGQRGGQRRQLLARYPALRMSVGGIIPDRRWR